METSEIKKMLTAYNLDPENEAVRSYFAKDNIWTILDIQRYEPSHSAFLVWFFSQKVTQYSHLIYLLNLLVAKAGKKLLSNGWNVTADMSSFAYAILTSSYSIKTVSVTPELCVNKLSNIPDNDRLDVYIRCTLSLFDDKGNEQETVLEIIIENKVDSSEGEGKKKKAKDLSKCPTYYQSLHQTERYYYACSKEHGQRKANNVDYQFFVFLTPDRKQCKSDNYVLISYQDLIDYVFENFLKREDVDANSRSLIKAYLHNLGNPFNKNNKDIIAMTTEEKELLVSFYNRNKQLFETTIEALIKQAADEGDAETAAEFSKVKEGLKRASGQHYYTINGAGKYSTSEIVKEYIIFKLMAGVPFEKILRKSDGKPITHIGPSFISTNPNGVIVHKKNGQKPYTFNYHGQDYYITTQLRDSKPGENIWTFREYVNNNESDFKIEFIEE